MLLWAWNNTCRHKAPFWPVRDDANEGKRSLKWNCHECRKARKLEKAGTSWLNTLDRLNRLDGLVTDSAEPGSYEWEAQQTQQVTRFQREGLDAETQAATELDPMLLHRTLIRRAYKNEQKIFTKRNELFRNLEVAEVLRQRQARERELANEEESEKVQQRRAHERAKEEEGTARLIQLEKPKKMLRIMKLRREETHVVMLARHPEELGEELGEAVQPAEMW